ncbi:hypothetical protein DF046_36835 [Burkholderia cepacia]|uniref:NUMOD4 motif-containing HNH endonuclease n=1 Tax=Burkholderia cepacia TaxID=292 RepID=UPI000F5AFE93|nr:NUMOD4 motif-containing HNH endonuclease [Burkholderia cepacia]RQT43146.1 hypothetical protein DF046_36835 [Burkholderia cepacia]
MKHEQWRDIPGFEGRYQVSDMGRVRSLDRRVRVVPHGIETTRLVRGRILKPGPSKSGHLSVVLGRGNTRSVHALVMLAFEGPCPEGMEVLHLNHTPSDNRRTNLKYGTRGENVAMDHAAGTRKVHPNFIGARWRARAAA